MLMVTRFCLFPSGGGTHERQTIHSDCGCCSTVILLTVASMGLKRQKKKEWEGRRSPRVVLFPTPLTRLSHTERSLFTHERTAVWQPAITLRVESNREELLGWCGLEYFGLFHPSVGDGSDGGHQNADVCIHVGPPKHAGYPYTLTAEVDNFTDAVRRIEEHSVWGENGVASALHPTRWLTQPLLDGFVSRRVVAHVGLTSGTTPHTLAMARRLKVALPPSELSPFYFANGLLSSWGLFGDINASDIESVTDDVGRVVQLAHASTALSMYRSVWLNGAALCNDHGDAVMILGPRISGKTTLALHCLAAASSHLRLIGLENFHVAPKDALVTAGEMEGGPWALFMGLPASARVGIGALPGTLRPNPALMAAAAHTYHHSATNVQQLIRNSELTIWNTDMRYPIHIGEAFGSGRWCPASLGRLKGILVLNWDLRDLALSQSRERVHVVQSKSRAESLAMIRRLAEERGASLFKGH